MGPPSRSCAPPPWRERHFLRCAVAAEPCPSTAIPWRLLNWPFGQLSLVVGLCMANNEAFFGTSVPSLTMSDRTGGLPEQPGCPKTAKTGHRPVWACRWSYVQTPDADQAHRSILVSLRPEAKPRPKIGLSILCGGTGGPADRPDYPKTGEGPLGPCPCRWSICRQTSASYTPLVIY